MSFIAIQMDLKQYETDTSPILVSSASYVLIHPNVVIFFAMQRTNDRVITAAVYVYL